jgi:CheY-like chemotaxis protein
MLLVENDQPQRDEAAAVLRRRGWEVDIAVNGKDALEKVRPSGGGYQVIVLDLRMPEMNGEEFLECIQDEEIEIPPVIVLSAFLDDSSRKKCAFLGASCVLRKPYDPDNLSKVALAVASQVPPLVETEFDTDLLDYVVRRREAALSKHLSKVADADRRPWKASEPVLVVLRRWNSWYPSVFSVVGGAYAVVGPTDQTVAPPVALIDPGFQSMKALIDAGVPWTNLNTCIVSHNHPDHIGGIFELMAARHALRKQTRVLCSPACAHMLGDCAGFNLQIKELDHECIDVFVPYESGGCWTRCRVYGFGTAHEEIGRQNSSRGLCITWESGTDAGRLGETAELVLVGDTDYDRAQHMERLMTEICKPNVKVAVLHVGSSQLKQGTGKHLYLSGFMNILSDIDARLSAIKYRGSLLVLVSEWGLEHATREQIANACGSCLPGFNEFSPILETIRYAEKGLQKIRLIPTDVGLVVGMESGNIYLQSGDVVPPEACKAELTDKGLKYVRREPTAQS